MLKSWSRGPVLLENFRPDVNKRLGTTTRRSRRSTRASYTEHLGFGQTGPYAEAPASTRSRRAGGLMSVTGIPGHGPLRVGIPIADLCGGIFAAYCGTVPSRAQRPRAMEWLQTSLLRR